MEVKSGAVSINAENMFPIIKKWLYSEKDIFIREIISNGSDAINKLRKLISVGEAEVPEDDQNWRIEVSLDKEAGTITIFDNGIGMTEEEVLKYINQIAFSGAKDFLEKYQNKTDDAQIIGHFGLGFFSVFMVATKVEIDTKSWMTGSEAVHWESESGMDYSMSASEIENRGTYITIHVDEESKEFLESYKLKEIINKYFAFLPIDLYFVDVAEDLKAEKKDDVQEAEVCENEKSTCEECTDEECSCSDHDHDHEKKEENGPKPMNDTHPLWMKAQSEVTEEEYKSFYHKVFNDYNDPLFWIHLNIDYPFNLKGILYFPKLNNEYDRIEGKIKVYYNQVFVADNVKEILPEFLMLLKGVIDCPDLPLNVSRSFLQNDGYTSKIATHITKKVADKLTGLYNTEKDNYCKYWDDINPFVKFGCIKDEKLYDKVKDVILYKTTDGEYLTKGEFADAKAVYFTDNPVQQSQYIKMLKDSDIKVIILDGPIDNHFISYVEYKESGNVKFVRVDAQVNDAMKNKESTVTKETLDAMALKLEPEFRKVSENDTLKVTMEDMKTGVPAILLLSEQGRRMQEMMKMYGSMGMPMSNKDDISIVLNNNNSTIKRLCEILSKEDHSTYDAEVSLLCSQIYDLAMLVHKPMSADELTKFIERSSDILDKLSEGSLGNK